MVESPNLRDSCSDTKSLSVSSDTVNLYSLPEDGFSVPQIRWLLPNSNIITVNLTMKSQQPFYSPREKSQRPLSPPTWPLLLSYPMSFSHTSYWEYSNSALKHRLLGRFYRSLKPQAFLRGQRTSGYLTYVPRIETPQLATQKEKKYKEVPS